MVGIIKGKQATAKQEHHHPVTSHISHAIHICREARQKIP